jgi:hypothetical protein
MSKLSPVKSSTLPVHLLRFSLLLALAPFLLLMAYTHPFFDDFRTAYWVREHGLWGMQRWFYQTWTGRYTSTFFMAVLCPVTYGWLEGVKPVLVLIFLTQWASITLFLRTFLRLALRVACSWGTALWTAVLLLTLFCNGTRAPFSFLYWFSGAVAYQIPLIGLLTFATLALQAGWGPERRQWLCAVLACGPLVLALVGVELTMVQTLPVLALFGYLSPPAARPKWWLWVVVGGLATIIAVMAPGNWLRVIATAPTDRFHTYRWLLLLPRTAYSIVLFLVSPMIGLSVLAAAATGLWLGFKHRTTASPLVRFSGRQWRAALLALGATNGAGFLFFRYVVVGAPFLRAQNEILLVMLISVTMLTWAAAQQLPQLAHWEPRLFSYGRLLALLLAGLFSLGHVPEAWRELLTSAASFDVQMQARYATLRAAHLGKAPAVVLPPLRLPYGHVLVPLRQFSSDIEFDLDLTPGCEGNINGVLERYFEVPQVCCNPRALNIVPPR